MDEEVKSTTETPAETTTVTETEPTELVVVDAKEGTDVPKEGTEEQTQVAPETEIVSDDNSTDAVADDISSDPELAHIYKAAEQFGISKERAIELGEGIVDVVSTLQNAKLGNTKKETETQDVPEVKKETKPIESDELDIDKAVEDLEVTEEFAEKLKAKEAARVSELAELKAEISKFMQEMKGEKADNKQKAIEERYDNYMGELSDEHAAVFGSDRYAATKEQFENRQKLYFTYEGIAASEGAFGNPAREKAAFQRALLSHSDIMQKAYKEKIRSKLSRQKGGMLPRAKTVPAKKDESPKEAFIREANQLKKERGFS